MWIFPYVFLAFSEQISISTIHCVVQAPTKVNKLMLASSRGSKTENL